METNESFPLPLKQTQLSSSERFSILDDLNFNLALEGQETFNRQHIGHVYVLGSSTGYYKIGQTTNLYRRLKKFEVALPFKIWLELSLPFYDCIWAEKFFHAHFFDKRLNGEWFNLTYDDLLFMQNHSDTNENTKFNFIYGQAELCPWSQEFITEGLGKYYPTPDIRWILVSRFEHEMSEKVRLHTDFEEQFYLRGMKEFFEKYPPKNPTSNLQEQANDDSSN